MDTRKEIWKNGIAGTIGVLTTNSRGDIGTVIVRSGQSVALSPEDRVLNSERAASADQDFFKNGMLVPVRLFDDVEGFQEISANPNLMAESDMLDLFKAHWKTFETKVNEISNETAIRRMLELAEANDATVKQVNVIQKRLNQVKEKPFVEPDPETDRPDGETFRPVTPL